MRCMPTMMDNTAHALAQATVYRLDSRFFCYAGASTTDPSESFLSLKRLAEGSAGTAEGRRSLRRSAKSTNSLAALSPPLSRPHVQHTGDGCGHVVEVHDFTGTSESSLPSIGRVQVLCAGDLSIRLTSHPRKWLLGWRRGLAR